MSKRRDPELAGKSPEPAGSADERPAGGCGSMGAVASILLHEHAMFEGARVIRQQNKPDGWEAAFADIGARSKACEPTRTVRDLEVRSFDIPSGCAAGYFPECNPLIPLWHHAEGSQVPAAKSVPIRVSKPL